MFNGRFGVRCFLFDFMHIMGYNFFGDIMKEMFRKIGKSNAFMYKMCCDILYAAKSDVQKEAKIKENIDKLAPELYNNKQKFKKIYKDLLGQKYIYGITYLDEYFLFDFPNRSFKERKAFVGTDEYLRNTKKIKTKEVEEHPILKDKYSAYQTLKKYYKRDIVPIKSFADFAEFNAFVQKHPVFLIKKETGSLGKNITKYDLSDGKTNPKTLFLALLSKGQWVAEEMIEQCDEMAAFHPTSVNTVRIATFYDKNKKLTKLFAMFRTGSGNSVVDNASSGGICASIDLKTGIIESNGYKKNGEIVELQPDTKHIIKGFQIPQWDELLHLADEVAFAVPYYNYIGWDFALTDNGWVVVEGNSRPNINSIQMCSGRGLRKILDETLGLGE